MKSYLDHIVTAAVVICYAVCSYFIKTKYN